MDTLLVVSVVLLLLFVTFALAPAGMRRHNRPTPPKQEQPQVTAIEKRREQVALAEQQRQAEQARFQKRYSAFVDRHERGSRLDYGIERVDGEIVDAEATDVKRLGAGRKQLGAGRRRLTG